MSSLVLSLLQWQRPFWGALGALALVILLLARGPARPAAEVTGTLALWRRVAAGRTRRRELRRRPPLDAWLAALAVLLAAAAAAGPRWVSAGGRLWEVLVDARHVSTVARTDADGARLGGTRIAAALAGAERLLAQVWSADDRVDWRGADFEGRTEEPVAPAALFDALARAPADRIAPFEGSDRPGVLWVSGPAPEPAPARAGAVWSGGGPVPGAVVWEGSDAWVWEGGALRRAPDAVPARRLELAEELGRGSLGAFARLWAGERGLELGGSNPVALSIRPGPLVGEARVVRAGRDGWWTDWSGAPGPPTRGHAAWLTADGSVLVEHRPGSVLLRATPGEPAGDPAAFAVSWAELLDDAVLPPEGVLPLAVRQPAGDAGSRDPEPPSPSGRPPRPLAFVLAIGAALCALAAHAARVRLFQG